MGFDLEPHTAQFAIPVVTRPELFRWFKLSDNKTSLEGGVTDDEMLAETHLQRITEEIRAIVSNVMNEHALQNLDADDSSQERDHK